MTKTPKTPNRQKSLWVTKTSAMRSKRKNAKNFREVSERNTHTKNLTTLITSIYTFMIQKSQKPGTRNIDFDPFSYFPVYIHFLEFGAKPTKNMKKSRTSRTRIDYQ